MKYLALLALAAAPLAASADEPADSAAVDSTKTFVFTDVISIPTTSVKDQNRSGTCWCFAGTSYFEDEILRLKGDSLDISEMYTVRKCYEDKADRFIRLYGECNFAAGGSILDVPYVWKRYGAVPEEVYGGLNYGEKKHDHSELDAALSAYLKAVVKKPGKKLTTAWRQGLNGILDAYFGPVPETFEYKGKTYTPASYAESLGLKMDDYVPVTSFSHHPFYETFVVEVPDNWLWGQYYNVPLDDFKAIIDNSLEKGLPLVWAADVSEPGFQWAKGVALMPKAKDDNLEGTELARWVKLSDKERSAERYKFDGPTEEITVTQQSRQEMFDNQETTDDHGMEIVGTAVDQNGNRYYKVKNSWDSNQIYNGFFYVSEPYVLAKTVDILVHRDAIPKDIAKKMKIK
ncbi:MAG: C1 family peptidase [Muribaculaceae bacterium]|nr:C1 family peptidase [Muribaculaceae bacterium]